MSTATTVPTNGFIAPPQVNIPAAPNPDAQGFVVPPAGDPPRLNGVPIQMGNQQPGFVAKPGQTAAAPAAPTAPEVTDLGSLVAALQGVLGQQPTAPTQGTGLAAGLPAEEKPAWLGESANKFDLSKIDDPILKTYGSMLQTIGKDLDLDRVLGRALANGDPTLVDVAYLAEKGGANAQNIAELAKGLVQAVQAKSEAITQEVYASVGGEAQWNQATAVFNQKAPHELKLVVTQMLNSTKAEFIKAGAKLVAGFMQASGAAPQVGSKLLNLQAGAGAAQGLSAADFKAELAKINQYQPDFESKRAELFQRRTAGKALGL